MQCGLQDHYTDAGSPGATLSGWEESCLDVRLPSTTSCHKEASPPSTVASGFLPFPLGPTVTGFEGDDVTDHSVCYSGRKQGTQWY